MDLKYLTIGIKGLSIEKAETVLMELGISNYLDKIREMFKINITIQDNRDEFAYASKFLEENNLEDENTFFKDFKIEPYGLQIDFEVTQSFKYLDVLEPMVFIFGQRISLILKAECIIMFESMRLPAGLFKGGFLTETFEKYNSVFFENRPWKPNKVENLMSI